MLTFFYYISHTVVLILIVLLSVAFFTLAERNILSAIQRRMGPNVVGVFGILQPIADGLKLMLKEPIKMQSSNSFLFIFAPNFSFIIALTSWGVIPFDYKVLLVDVNVGILYLLMTSALGVLGLIIAGWSSNSKYSFLGALRSTSQMISYELAMGFIFTCLILCSGSLNLSDIVLAQEETWFWKPLLPIFIFYIIIMLAETNRHPFDLPEAEPEIVAGYITEYSGMLFSLFYLGEYSNMLLMSSLGAICFFGGWLPILNIKLFLWLPGSFWFGLKTVIFIILFIKARADLPRFRYDQIMNFGWKVALPFTFAYTVFIASILFYFYL